MEKLMADDQIEIQSPFISASLVDPVSSSQMLFPARGKYCEHTENFDLIFFLENNAMPKENRWKCPRCQLFVEVELIRIDLILF
jgi:MIZ/SP-RING zinc finger